MNSQLIIEMIKLVGVLLSGIITGYLAIKLEIVKLGKQKDKPQPAKTDLLQNSLKLAQDIDSEMFTILNEIGCDRITLSTFSNGSKFYTGEPAQFANMSFEKVRRGITPISKDFRRIPISHFAYFYSQFKNHDVAHFNIDEVEDDTYREIMHYYDDKTIYGFLIYGPKNEWVGVLQLNWLQTKKQLTQDEIAYVRMKGSTIGNMLENWNKYLVT